MTDAEKYVRERIRAEDLHFCGPMRNGRPHPDGWYLLVVGSASYAFATGKTKIECWANAANKLEATEPAGKEGK